MKNSLCVRIRHGIYDLDRVAKHTARDQSAAADQLIESVALDMLHDDEVGSIEVADVVNGDDVGVV